MSFRNDYDVRACCEYCGRQASRSLVRFVIEKEYVIPLRSAQVAAVDETACVVILVDGSKFEYDILYQDEATKLKSTALAHNFCSNECIYNFIPNPNYSTQGRLDVIGVFRGSRAIGDCFRSVVMEPRLVRHYDVKCDQCGTIFPNADRHHRSVPITSSRTIQYRHPDMPEPDDRYLGIGTASELRPDGIMFRYEADFSVLIGEDRRKQFEFCSNECACEFAKKNNCLIVFESNALGGYWVYVTPETDRINQLLGNSYKYRPHKLSPLPE